MVYFLERSRSGSRSNREAGGAPDEQQRSLVSLSIGKKESNGKNRTFVDRGVRCDGADALSHDVRDGLVPRRFLFCRGRGSGGAEGRRKIELLAAAAAERRSSMRRWRSKRRRRARRPEGSKCRRRRCCCCCCCCARVGARCDGALHD